MSEEKPRLEPASNGYQVLYHGRRLYSPRDPRGGAVRRAEAVGEVATQTLVIVASPLLCYGLEALLQSCPSDAVLLAVELDPQLAELTQSTDSVYNLSHDHRLFWMLAPSDSEVDAFLPRILSGRPRRTRLVALSGGFGLRASEYRRLTEHFENEIRIFWQNAMTRVHMGRLWIRNLFRNLTLLPQSIPLGALHTTLPTVVVGAGPSLDGLVERLPAFHRDNRDYVCIIAVDTAVAPLSAHGITPDIVVAVESQQANAADFLAPLPTMPHLICDMTAYPGTARMFAPHGLTFVSSRFAPSALLDRLRAQNLLPEEVPPLGSVGVLAVHLARRLTSGSVFFAGLDFNYDLERTHARGAPMHTLSLVRRRRLDPSPFFGTALARPLVSLVDKSGRNTRSDTVLLSYAEQLRAVVGKSTHLYDLSSGIGIPNGAPAARHVLSQTPPESARAWSEPRHRRQGPHPPQHRRQGRLHRSTASQANSFSAAQVHAWLEGERNRLEALIEQLRAALRRAGANQTVSREDYETLLPGLERSDYLYLDFPDPPSNSRAFLGRVLLSALSYQQKLADILTLLGRI